MALENVLIEDANGVQRKITVDLHDTDSFAQAIKIAFGADGATPILASSANPLPVVDSAVAHGVYAYAAGTAAGTVNVPADARVKRVSVVASSAGTATVTVAGGATITIPAEASFDDEIPGDATLGGDVVIGGNVSAYYVAWTVV